MSDIKARIDKIRDDLQSNDPEKRYVSALEGIEFLSKEVLDQQAQIATLQTQLDYAQTNYNNAMGQAVANGRKHALVRSALLQIMSLQDGVMIEAQLREMRDTVKSLAGVSPDTDAVRVTLHAIAVLLGEVE